MKVVFQYAVKFICGNSNGRVVAPGKYWTAINVHNPGYQAISFVKKIAIALPNENPGPVSPLFSARLGPDQALEIDNDDIFRHSGTKEEFLKGFVVIQSDVKLDVVAVYTVASPDGQVRSLDIERVRRRRIKLSLPDLIPVPDKNGFFCKKTEKGDALIVTVKNQGASGAGPSTTEVDFFTHGRILKATSPLAPSASVDIEFPFPPRCFDPDCQFRITVDVNNDVAESDEGNNVADGVCLG